MKRKTKEKKRRIKVSYLIIAYGDTIVVIFIHTIITYIFRSLWHRLYLRLHFIIYSRREKKLCCLYVSLSMYHNITSNVCMCFTRLILREFSHSLLYTLYRRKIKQKIYGWSQDNPKNRNRTRQDLSPIVDSDSRLRLSPSLGYRLDFWDKIKTSEGPRTNQDHYRRVY